MNKHKDTTAASKKIAHNPENNRSSEQHQQKLYLYAKTGKNEPEKIAEISEDMLLALVKEYYSNLIIARRANLPNDYINMRKLAQVQLNIMLDVLYPNDLFIPLLKQAAEN